METIEALRIVLDLAGVGLSLLDEDEEPEAYEYQHDAIRTITRLHRDLASGDSVCI